MNAPGRIKIHVYFYCVAFSPFIVPATTVEYCNAPVPSILLVPIQSSYPLQATQLRSDSPPTASAFNDSSSSPTDSEEEEKMERKKKNGKGGKSTGRRVKMDSDQVREIVLNSKHCWFWYSDQVREAVRSGTRGVGVTWES